MDWLKVFSWLLGLFVIYLIIEVIRKILGGSLGYEALIVGLLVTNLGYTIGLHGKIIGLHGKIADIKAQLSEHLGWHKGKENHRQKL